MISGLITLIASILFGAVAVVCLGGAWWFTYCAWRTAKHIRQCLKDSNTFPAPPKGE